MISKYELGQAEPDIQTLITIARFFSVSVDYLIGLSNEKMDIFVSDFTKIKISFIHMFLR